MLWQYTCIYLGLGVLASILCFRKDIEDIGVVFWHAVGMMSFLVAGWGLQKVQFYAAGSTNFISYTNIPDGWLAYVLIFSIGGLGVLHMFMLVVRTPGLLWKQNTVLSGGDDR